MYEWHRDIQVVVDAIDAHIQRRDDAALTLPALAGLVGYSPFHTTRKFRQLAGLPLREYLRLRRLAFALIEVRDNNRRLLDIALDYGFSSQQAFTRAFRGAYGITPAAYRKNPAPVVLCSKVRPFDRYLLGIGEIGMIQSSEQVKAYFIAMPAHTLLYIKNYDSDGYFDFWEKQATIPGQDCDTICGLLDSISGKLDGEDGVIGEYSGQIMAHLYEADSRVAEAYGIRLPEGYAGPVPTPLLRLNVPAGEYLVFEHGAFDYDQECETVGEKLAEAIEAFDLSGTGYTLQEETPRVGYFFFDPARFEKIVKPVRRK